MSFSASCTGWELEHGHILKAKARNEHGAEVVTVLDLNSCIGNSDGWFKWGETNFSNSARDIKLDGTKLCAYLKKKDGGTRDYQGIDLNDKITNRNGTLRYVH